MCHVQTQLKNRLEGPKARVIPPRLWRRGTETCGDLPPFEPRRSADQHELDPRLFWRSTRRRYGLDMTEAIAQGRAQLEECFLACRPRPDIVRGFGRRDPSPRIANQTNVEPHGDPRPPITRGAARVSGGTVRRLA